MKKSAEDRETPWTTFTIRDVAVVVVATFSAAVAFFAYDTRISVLESQNSQLTELAAIVDSHISQHATFRSELDQLNKHHDREEQQMAAMQQEVATLKEKEIQLERQIESLRRGR